MDGKVGNEIFDLAPGADPMSELGVTEAPVVETPVTPVVETPKVETPVVATPDAPKVEDTKEATAEEKAAAKKFELSDDDEIAILQDGKTVHVRWGDHKGGVMRQADYSRKTAKLAEDTKKVTETASQLRAREEKLLQIMQDRERFLELGRKLHGETFAVPPVGKPEQTPEAQPDAGGDEIVSKKDLEAFKQNWLAEQKAAREKDASTAQELAQQREVETFVQTIHKTSESTIDEILKNPTVADTVATIPHVDRVLKALAAEKNPGSAEEVKQALLDAAKELHTQLLGRKTETARQEALSAPAKKVGIEPSRGVPPAQAPKDYTDPNDPRKVDWKSVDADVVSWINGGGQ